jgi:Ser/Thr protein kinase RdoA (MazF antagonist)
VLVVPMSGDPYAPISASVTESVLRQHGLRAERLHHGRGTASRNVTVDTRQGRFLIRRRRPEYSDTDVIRHDHSMIRHLSAAGFPCAQPREALDGHTWVEVNGAAYEVTPMIEGVAFDPSSDRQLRAVGQIVGRLHELTADWAPPPGKEWTREDDPQSLREPLASLIREAQGDERHALERAQGIFDDVEAALPRQRYAALPQCVIHGDLHPGNALFCGDNVAGLFDWDWASRQARARDVCDGLVFFAAGRAEPIDGADIRSLTQAWHLRPRRAAIFLAAYSELRPLSAEELDACRHLIHSRWLQSRIRGARKVAPEERARFVADGLLEPLRHLEREWRAIAG